MVLIPPTATMLYNIHLSFAYSVHVKILSMKTPLFQTRRKRNKWTVIAFTLSRSVCRNIKEILKSKIWLIDIHYIHTSIQIVLRTCGVLFSRGLDCFTMTQGESFGFATTRMLELLCSECMNCFVSISVSFSGDTKSLPVLPLDFWSPLPVWLSLTSGYTGSAIITSGYTESGAISHFSGYIRNQSNAAMQCCETKEEDFRKEEPRRSLQSRLAWKRNA